jgi:predicted metalloendopeptidase
MTHGFDDKGRQYDAHGNLSDWWSAQSADRFKAHAAGIVKQFSEYTVLDGLHVNGQLTEGENIADLGGLLIAYDALERRLAGNPQPLIDGFTAEQRFFLSYAISWRDELRPEALRLQVQTDPHSPANFRVNGPLSNVVEFSTAFGVPENSPMLRAVAERVAIW